MYLFLMYFFLQIFRVHVTIRVNLIVLRTVWSTNLYSQLSKGRFRCKPSMISWSKPSRISLVFFFNSL